MIKKLLIVFLCCIPKIFFAATLTVPAQYSSIQTAINASADGDSVIVSPGTYFENINFRGKNICLTSLYYLAGDTSYISSTVINGSTPVHADTASCVLIVSGEDSTAVLQGFTLTGGGGTSWQDIHNLNSYREGGGIFIEISSPKILHNIIINNHITNAVGVVSTGGGGIRMGDSNPLIQNNLIIGNEAIYGPGVVMNYSGAVIRNNIIASNYGGQNYYGGSGLWILDNLGTTPKVIENNTIINNSCAASNGTGGILVWGANFTTIRNNIIRGNSPGAQFKILSATPTVSYNITSGVISGTGNIFTDPLLDPQCNSPFDVSPAVDAGDSSVIYNDLTVSAGVAQLPSHGTERNDIGATGGPFAAVMNCIESVTSVSEATNTDNIYVFPNPASEFIYIKTTENCDAAQLSDCLGRIIISEDINSDKTTINVADLPGGIYFINIISENRIIYTIKALVQK